MAVAVDNIDMGNEADVAMRANDVKTVVISAVRWVFCFMFWGFASGAKALGAVDGSVFFALDAVAVTYVLLICSLVVIFT